MNMLPIIHKLRKTNLFNRVSIGDELQLQRTLEEQKNIVAVVVDQEQSVHVICEVHNKFAFLNDGNNTYKVLTAYHNGISDRTTYDGLHHGCYDLVSYDEALEVAEKRSKGSHKVIDVFDSLSKDLDFVPMKYRKMLCMGSEYISKEDGYWVYLKDGYVSENGFGCQTIHEYTQKEVLRQLRQVVVAEQ